MTLILKNPLAIQNPVYLSAGNTPAQIAGVAPTLDYRFARDRSEIDAVSLTDKLTVTTVDADGTFFNQSGQLQQAESNTPRFDHSPTTRLSQGLLLEPERTNELPNNTMVGAVLGTPGTVPTNWGVISSLGLTRSIVETGVEDGLPYYDLNMSGTTASAVDTGFIRFHSVAQVLASSGEAWRASCYFRLISGAFTGTWRLALREVSSTSTILANTTTSIVGATSAPLATQRYTTARTFNNASTVYANSVISAAIASGVTVDFTLRIGPPQLEKATSVSSLIPTSTAAVTRSADDIKIAAGSGVITGTYTMVEKPSGCATVSGTDILLNTGYTAERVMVFPTSLSAGQITAIRAAM